MGLRFDASEAAAFWHFIEPELLRERLVESVFYLHSQPPLFNLWLGVYHKLFGDAMPLAFAVTYVTLGAALCVQMHALARAAAVSPWLRTVGVAVFCASPAVLLYENFLLYSYPVAMLLTWSAARLHRALETGRERDWFVFSAIVVALVLMRALYHPALAGTRPCRAGVRPAAPLRKDAASGAPGAHCNAPRWSGRREEPDRVRARHAQLLQRDEPEPRRPRPDGRAGARRVDSTGHVEQLGHNRRVPVPVGLHAGAPRRRHRGAAAESHLQGGRLDQPAPSRVLSTSATSFCATRSW